MKIEINDKKYYMPEDFGKITLTQYEQICGADREDEPLIISILTGIPKDDVYQLPVDVYEKIYEKAISMIEGYDVSKVKARNSVMIDGTEYTVNYADKMTFGEYIDTRDAGLTQILSVILRPTGEKYDSDKMNDRQELFGRQKIEDVLPVISFFLLRRREYLNSLAHSSLLLQTQEECVRNINDLARIGGPLRPSIRLQVARLRIMIGLSNSRWWRALVTSRIKRRSLRRKRLRTDTSLSSTSDDL